MRRRTLLCTTAALVATAVVPAQAAAATTKASIRAAGTPKTVDGIVVFKYKGSFAGALGRGRIDATLRYPGSGTRSTVSFTARRRDGARLTMKGAVRFSGLAISGKLRATRASGGYSRSLVGKRFRVTGMGSSSPTGTVRISLSR